MASQSLSRQKILTNAGVPFIAVPSQVDEEAIKRKAKDDAQPTENLATTLARAKAEVVSAQYPYSYVLAADQILDCEGRLFDKPTSLAQARRHLQALRGKSHKLINGLILMKGSHIEWTHTAIATLHMRSFSDRFLETYLETAGESILSSVGAYRLEESGSQLFDTIDGDYFTILGLPLLPLLAYLRHIHILEE